MSGELAIETRGLTRHFRKKTAVDQLNLRVPMGSVFAFLGPNGAGKTTTIKMLMNILRPSSGEGTVLGAPITHVRPEIMAQIGYVSENQKMPEWMTVGQLLAYCKPWYPTWDDAFCAALLKQFDLPVDRKLRHLSRGMKMKAALLSSLAYRPRLLVLDEPFSGLDPLVRDEFIRGVLELTAQEKWTVFVSSHDIDEVERLASWVGFLNDGVLTVCDPVAQLQRRYKKVEVVLAGETSAQPNLPAECLLPESSGRTIRFVDSAADSPERVEALHRLFPAGAELTVSPMGLRDIFLTLTRQGRIQKERGVA
ncbi:MAG: ABC transporter ATP-binding protein [Kiritimatiellae bacterium]|nr:ABC transporter ATP-binding protein [Kiritimatiellia bacterium]MCO5069219.1 ABC transporter ATP-binding protein [Kiritimatiellia bacterium]